MIAGLQITQSEYEGGEAIPRRVSGQRAFGQVLECLRQQGRQRCVDEFLASRESVVERPDADLGAHRDGLQRSAEPALLKLDSRGFEQFLAIAARIGA